ncbi:MAG: hypothetical protein C5B59_12935 [Bacteroidetes bacterium]|nr:MAG: hypothetical protein C5B59_12935 [Bacteroidota bacterium]
MTYAMKIGSSGAHGVSKRGRPHKYEGLKGQWSKFGGARMAVVQEELGPIWVCQSCGQEQPNALKPYLYEWMGEYIRVCAICLSEDCKRLKARM